MAKVHRGVYRLDGEIGNPRDAPLVLVHPWYNEEKGNAFKVWGANSGGGLFEQS